MWICSQLGFFSIVQKLPGEYHIRGRVRTDMADLCRALGWSEEVILDTFGDYRFRIIATQEQVAAAMAAFGDSIDYSNFKSRIAALPRQREKMAAYHELWNGMVRIQDQSAEGPWPRLRRG